MRLKNCPCFVVVVAELSLLRELWAPLNSTDWKTSTCEQNHSVHQNINQTKFSKTFTLGWKQAFLMKIIDNNIIGLNVRHHLWLGETQSGFHLKGQRRQMWELICCVSPTLYAFVVPPSDAVLDSKILTESQSLTLTLTLLAYDTCLWQGKQIHNVHLRMMRLGYASWELANVWRSQFYLFARKY